MVDAQIWSNSKFKLCLKVQTKEDSNEVIKSPLAAEIVEPGRAYFQVGNNEIFELFQSAYSGVKVADDGDDKAKAFAIYALNSWGKKEIVYTNKKKNRTENAKTQLQVIVDYVEDYCRLQIRLRRRRYFPLLARHKESRFPSAFMMILSIRIRAIIVLNCLRITLIS